MLISSILIAESPTFLLYLVSDVLMFILFLIENCPIFVLYFLEKCSIFLYIGQHFRRGTTVAGFIRTFIRNCLAVLVWHFLLNSFLAIFIRAFSTFFGETKSTLTNAVQMGTIRTVICLENYQITYFLSCTNSFKLNYKWIRFLLALKNYFDIASYSKMWRYNS